MTPSDPSRRRVLVSLALPLLSTFGCSREEYTCTSTAGLSPKEVEARAAIGYVDRGPNSAQVCEGCHQWLAPEQAGHAPCGGCKLVAGPIHPSGTCRLFSARG